MRLLVTGASGLLGRELVREAKDAGHEVFALSRAHSVRVAELADEEICRDVLELRQADLPEGLDAVLHLAIGQDGGDRRVVDVAVEGTCRVLAAALACGVPRFVHVSSISVYPAAQLSNGTGRGARELDPRPQLRGAYARAKVLSELALHEHERAADRLELVILRPGLVFSPDMKGALAGVGVALPLGLMLGLGVPDHGVPVLTVGDFARGAIALLQRPPTAGAVAVYDVLSGKPPRRSDFLARYRELSGQRAHEIWVPRRPALLAAELLDRLRATGGIYAHSVRRMYGFDSRGLDHTGFWAVAGTEPHADARAALASALSIDRTQPLDPETTPALRQRARSLLDVAAGASRPTESHARDRGTLVLVGAGYVALDMHVPAVLALGGSGAQVVVDPDRRCGEEVAQRLGARHAPAISALADEELDGATAVLATPGFSHHDLGCDLLERGAHLLVEKPLALSADELARLTHVASASNRVVTVVHNYRLRPGVLALWRFLLVHDVGALVRARIVFRAPRVALEHARWAREEKVHRSLVLEMAIHFLDLASLVGGALVGLDHVSVIDRTAGDATLTVSGHGRLRSCDSFAFELDVSGTARSVKLELEFERCACVLDFYPDGFRVLPRDGTPLDDATASLARLGGALRRRLLPRERRALARARPHLAIYREHLRRITGAEASVFSLDGVADTMQTAFAICDAVYPAPPVRAPDERERCAVTPA